MLTTFDNVIKLILGFQKVSTTSIKSKMSHQLPVISQQKVSSKWLIISDKTLLYTLIAQKNFKLHPMTFHSDNARKIVFSVSSGGKVFAALPSRYSMQHTVNMPS